MKRRWAAGWRFGGLALFFVLGLTAISGCRNWGSGTTTDPMWLEVWDEKIDQMKAEQAATREKQAALAEQAAREKEEKQKAEKKKNAAPRLRLDPSKIRDMQLTAIQEQQEPAKPGHQTKNSFTRWLDSFHELWYCRLDNSVRLVDIMWLKQGDGPYTAELSTFQLKVLTRAGGRSDENEYDFKVRFSGDVALPGLEKKFHVIVDNAPREVLPGRDPLEQETETRLGLRTVWRGVRNSELSLGGGARWPSSGPVGYLKLDWRWKKDWMGGKLSLDPRGFWYSDDGFGQVISLTWTRQVRDRQWFQSRTAERSTEQTHGLECEQTFRYVWLRSGQGRGWVAQASFFPHFKSSSWAWDDSMVNLSWRDALYRKWIYYTLTSQVDFPKEDGYDPRPSFRVGIAILFGGKIGDII